MDEYSFLYELLFSVVVYMYYLLFFQYFTWFNNKRKIIKHIL
jgi:hypothetical protein